MKLLHEPLTTLCGHSFCRSCLRRALQIAPLCPLCRAPCHVDASAATPSFLVEALLRRLFPRAAAARVIEAGVDAEELRHARLSLFFLRAGGGAVLPGMPVQLFVFEQRYLLLVRRCLENSTMFGLQEGPGARAGVSVRIESTAALPHGRIALVGRASGRYAILGASTEEAGCFGLHSAPVRFFADDDADAASALGVPAALELAVRGGGGEGVAVPPPPVEGGAAAIAAAASRAALAAALDGVDAAVAALRLRDACAAAVTRLVGALPPAQARLVFAHAGAMPPLSGPAANPEAWSYWLASSLALRPSQRRLAAALTSTITRLALCYAVLARADARARARREGGGGVGGQVDEFRTLGEAASPDEALAVLAGAEEDDDDDGDLEARLAICPPPLRALSLGLARALRKATRLARTPQVAQLGILVGVCAVLCASTHWP